MAYTGTVDTDLIVAKVNLNKYNRLTQSSLNTLADSGCHLKIMSKSKLSEVAATQVAEQTDSAPNVKKTKSSTKIPTPPAKKSKK